MIYYTDVSASNKSYLGMLAHCVSQYNLITNDPQSVVFSIIVLHLRQFSKQKKRRNKCGSRS